MKLFNGLRFKMIEGKRLKNYLVYAIGEIILVVIGILVAVAINNHNESKKTAQNISKIAAQVRQKIEADLVVVNDLRASIKDDLKIYNLYLKKDKTKSERLEVIFQAPFLVTLDIQFLPVNPIISATLERATVHNTAITNKLAEIEQDYKLMSRTVRPMEDIIKDELIKNLNHIKTNFSWYEKLVTTNSNFTVDEYKYFGSDDYRNRVVHMRFLYANGYDSILEDFEALLRLRLEELKAVI
ncbi:MAG: DUF6090 family protein [Winogradskyella sp.]|uniref:DUF6090 family protein n=1 Tax=Winogradskyella sp. TaxID=1883156 RepID=UPI00385927FD